jgi:hypothetical protein
MNAQRLTRIGSVFTCLFLLSACQLDGYRSSQAAANRQGLQAEFSSQYGYQSGNNLNGYTPATAPVNCFGAYTPCAASLQNVVDLYFPQCQQPVRRLCDSYGRPMLPEQFCVGGKQGFTQNQVLNACSG